ncbi:MAG: NIPSNAP family protein [Ginsengibacter sp.]
MNRILKATCIFFTIFVFSKSSYSKQTNNGIFQIRIYHLKNNEQVKATDHFLQTAFLPALHRLGIKNIGVFKPITNDTAAVKAIYVLIPFSSADQWEKVSDRLNSDAVFKSAAKDFLDADAKSPAFERMESILLEPFSAHPGLALPKPKNPERVFELRSYESPTEVLFEKKVAMFNTGGEIQIFNRLGFNPVFYGKVISGSRMPNLMYMPVFDNVQQKNQQWKKFGSDSTWKRISSDPANRNDVNVNHIDSTMMHSTDYSDY